MDFAQFRVLVSRYYGGLKQHTSEELAGFRQKLDDIRIQSRDQYFLFLTQLWKERSSFLNNFDLFFGELKILFELQDPEGLKLYTAVKQQFLKEGLDPAITFNPDHYPSPKPALDNLAKCLSYEVSKQNYETLNFMNTLLAGDVAVEQYVGLYVIKNCIRETKSLPFPDEAMNAQVLRRALTLLHLEYDMRVRAESVEFFGEIGQLEHLVPYLENVFSSDEINELCEMLLQLFSTLKTALECTRSLGGLFYDHVPGFIRSFLQALIDNEEFLRSGFGEDDPAFFHCIGLENKRKAAIEEFEYYDIPHYTVYHDELTECFDLAAEKLAMFQAEQFNSESSITPLPTLAKTVDLGRLLELPMQKEIAKLPFEVQAYLYAGIKRNYTLYSDSLVAALEHIVDGDHPILMMPKQVLNRFQVPPAIITSSIRGAENAPSSHLSRAIIFCPTSVALNKSVRKDITALMAKRMQEPIVNERLDRRPIVEMIELFRILGINSHTDMPNALIRHLLPVMHALGSGTTANSALHKHWFPLMQLCHGLIDEETAKQMLHLFLWAPFGQHLSVMLAAELSIIVNAVKSLTPSEASMLISHVTSGYTGWNIEDSYELLRTIGQRGEFTTEQSKNALSQLPDEPCYNVFNTFSGFESAVGSQDYLDFVISFVQKQIRPNNDVQLEFVLKGMNSLFDVHKKKSCAELFVAKMETLLNVIEPTMTDPSNETLLAFLLLIRNVLRSCPEQATSVLQSHSTVLRAIELASSQVSNLTMRDYAKQISSALKLH